MNTINYGGFLSLNKPLCIYRDYNRSIVDDFQWLGVESISKSIRIAAEKITILKEIKGVADLEEMELFLLNCDCEFIDLPENSLTKGRTFDVKDVYSLFLLPSEEAEEVKTIVARYQDEDLSPKEREADFIKALTEIEGVMQDECSIDFGEDDNGESLCLKYADLVPEGFAYWTTSISGEEFKSTAERQIEGHVKQFSYFNRKIDDLIAGAVSATIGAMTYPGQYGVKQIDQAFLQGECQPLNVKGKKVHDDMMKYAEEHKLNINRLKGFDLETELCTEFKKRVAQYVEDNASWLKDKATGVITTLFCNSTFNPFKC